MTDANQRQKLNLDIMELFSNEVRLSILLILGNYGSLNLRQMAKMLDMTEPSAHVHIKELLSEGYIELDNELAGKRGKYYKVVPEIEEFLESDDDHDEQTFETDDEITDPKQYELRGMAIQTVGLLSKRFTTYVGKYLVEHANELFERRQAKIATGDSDLKTLSGNLSFISVKNQEESQRVFDLINKFQKEIEEISRNNLNLSAKDAYEQIMVTSMAIPLLRFDPRK